MDMIPSSRAENVRATNVAAGCGRLRTVPWAAAGLAFLLCLSAIQPPRAEEPESGAATIEQAFVHWQNGYLLHLSGRYEDAADSFRKSIAAHPTAEGHTFLGWSLSELGQLDEAIAECKTAIEIDPDYGNPYNDIGVYLIELDRPDEAIPWLEKAMRAERYCCYQYPHFNLGRILLGQERVAEAKRAFERALSYDPNYLPARKGLEVIEREWGETL